MDDMRGMMFKGAQRYNICGLKKFLSRILEFAEVDEELTRKFLK
jgi:hypothetical protein